MFKKSIICINEKNSMNKKREKYVSYVKIYECIQKEI